MTLQFLYCHKLQKINDPYEVLNILFDEMKFCIWSLTNADSTTNVMLNIEVKTAEGSIHFKAMKDGIFNGFCFLVLPKPFENKGKCPAFLTLSPCLENKWTLVSSHPHARIAAVNMTKKN